MSMALNEWYADRQVLLTGVTSEVGRALLEKILRSFPNVKVYVVTRSRNGLNKDDRLKKIFSSPGYERLRQEDPNAISRVKVLEGNLLYDGLGTSNDDRATLKNVSVAFHAGGPHEAVFEFCQDLPRLEVLAAVSNIFRHKGQITEAPQNERLPDIPLALVRIPLVGPAYREPMPGFVEVLKGPTAFMAGAGLALGEKDLEAQVIPIDIAINTLVVAAWERGTAKSVRGPVIYNAATIGCKWNDLIKKGRRGNQKFAYPTFGFRGMTSNVTLHWILVLLLEWLPSVLCDRILSFGGGKQRFFLEYERARNALRSLESISSRPWPAERKRVYQLQKRLTPEEQDAFPVAAEIDIESYVLCATAAARKYCVLESNIGSFKIFRQLFLLLIAAVPLCMIFYKYNSSARERTETLRI